MYPGQGHFTRCLELLEKQFVKANKIPIAVCEILEPRLIPFLKKRGYVEYVAGGREGAFNPTYILVTPEILELGKVK